MKKNFLIMILAFSAAIIFLQASSITAEILALVPEERSGWNNIIIRERPSIFSQDTRRRIYVIWSFDVGAVDWTGEEKGGWIKIRRQDDEYFCSYQYGWVLGEFFGIMPESQYQPFDKPIIYVSIVDRINAREKPTILSRVKGFCISSGTKITIVGQKGNWLKTDRNKWVYYELLKLME